MAGFIRRFGFSPGVETITLIEGVIIVDLPPPGAINGVSAGTVGMVGEFPDMTYATAVDVAGLVNAIASGKGPAAPAFDLEVLWRRTDTWPRPLTAALIDGRLATAELRGRPTVLNFWASWCIPCRQEAPILTASARAHAGKVVFVGIDVQDLTGDAKAFLREFDVPYVSVRDGSERTYRVYGLTGVPETYYLDTAGRIIAHTPGAITRASLEAGISQATSGRPTP